MSTSAVSTAEAVAERALGLMAFIVRRNAVRRVGEPEAAVALDHDVIG